MLDFGLARPQEATGELTRIGAIIETPEYLAPEHLRGGGLDGRCEQRAMLETRQVSFIAAAEESATLASSGEGAEFHVRDLTGTELRKQTTVTHDGISCAAVAISPDRPSACTCGLRVGPNSHYE